MADNQYAQPEADTQHEKAIFVAGVIRIVESDRMIIEKHRLCLFECHAVIFCIAAILCLIPFEAQLMHMYSVHNRDTIGNGNYQAMREWNDETPVRDLKIFGFTPSAISSCRVSCSFIPSQAHMTEAKTVNGIPIHLPHLDTTLNVSPAMMSPSVPSASFTLKPS